MPFAQIQKVTANGIYNFRRDSDSNSSAGATLGATIVGPAGVAATILWEHSNDQEGWDLVATQTLSGTLLDKTHGTVQSFAPYFRATVSGFAGTYLNLSIGE